MRRVAELSLAAAALCAPIAAFAQGAAPACDKPVYLTFDTGHMGVADLVADVLRRHEVKASFFLANEKTQDGGSSLDERWAAWWKARAAEGHVFGSHTWDHVVWQADLPTGLKARPTAGGQAGRTQAYDAASYCEQLRRPARWFHEATGQAMLPLFRAPAGRTSDGSRPPRVGRGIILTSRIDSFAAEAVLAGRYKRGGPVPGWDGQAAGRIVDALQSAWG